MEIYSGMGTHRMETHRDGDTEAIIVVYPELLAAAAFLCPGPLHSAVFDSGSVCSHGLLGMFHSGASGVVNVVLVQELTEID